MVCVVLVCTVVQTNVEMVEEIAYLNVDNVGVGTVVWDEGDVLLDLYILWMSSSCTTTRRRRTPVSKKNEVA
jgi:hypothetical protein